MFSQIRSIPSNVGFKCLLLLSPLFLTTSAHASTSTELPSFVPDQWLLRAATGLFAVAVVHTFLTKQILRLSHRFAEGSVGQNIIHFAGEVEVVFGFWAFVLIALIASTSGTLQAIGYLQTVNFTEAAFVFVIMCMAATKPILQFAGDAIAFAARILPLSTSLSFYIAALILGPLLGSFITEPAAMTVVALLLKDRFYSLPMSNRFKYATLGLLFVNVSIGGTLSNFAAPPVLMVASAWGWSTPFMLSHFGWKSAVAIIVSTSATAFYFHSELSNLDKNKGAREEQTRVPFWMVFSHILFMVLCIFYHNYISFFLPLFLLFLGWCEVTAKYQEELKMRESLLVGFFLGGLVVLGGLQGWWLKPVLSSLSENQLFLGTTGLTALTDNAALTYLGTLVPSLSEAAKYALVAGAVAGGGLTVIANAPNPAGYGILQDSFGDDGISPGALFLAALPYTVVAMCGFFLL